MYLPRVLSTMRYRPHGSNVQINVAYLPDGKIVDASPLKPEHNVPDKELLKCKFRRTKEPVKGFDKRVKSLYFLTSHLAEYGMNDRAYKTIKRLCLVAFTCSLFHLKRMIKSIIRKNITRNDGVVKLAAVPEIKSWSNPSFTGEKKSILKLNGIELPLWRRVPVVKTRYGSSENDEWDPY
jgi:hypothetical protein